MYLLCDWMLACMHQPSALHQPVSNAPRERPTCGMMARCDCGCCFVMVSRDVVMHLAVCHLYHTVLGSCCSCKHSLLASAPVLGDVTMAGYCLGCRTGTKRGGWCCHERLAAMYKWKSWCAGARQIGHNVMYQPSCKCSQTPVLFSMRPHIRFGKQDQASQGSAARANSQGLWDNRGCMHLHRKS